jgi:hypothetical protein
LDLTGSPQVPMVGYFEHGNECAGYIKGKECLYQLNYYQLFNKESAP